MTLKGRVEQRAGYSIAQINHMRDVFGTQPYRPAGADPVVVGVAAHKGGAYKTATAVHLAQWLALQGLRVLLVDATDPQATASLYHGYVPDLHIPHPDTPLPFHLCPPSVSLSALLPTCCPILPIFPSFVSLFLLL